MRYDFALEPATRTGNAEATGWHGAVRMIRGEGVGSASGNQGDEPVSRRRE